VAERRRLLIAGAVLVLGVIAVVLTGTPAAWRAWLGVAVLATAVPTGAIGWTMAMRLAVEDWTGPVAEASAAIAGRMPLTAVLFLPVLLRPGLYPWVVHRPDTAFRAAWLSVPFFEARTIVWLIVMSLVGRAFASAQPSKPASAVGIIVLILAASLFAVDWLASLDREFNSSGFGLYVIALQFMAAMAMAVLAGRPEETHRAGALLFMMILLWGYFAFMDYFIPWSGNLRAGMAWYLARQHGPWPWLMGLIALDRLTVFFLLLFRHVRHSRPWMLTLAVASLAATAGEFAWLAMPGSGAGPAEGVIYAVLAAAGLALAWPPRGAIPDRGGAA
jgi:hypothetical protein